MKIEEATKQMEETIQEIEKSLKQCSLNFQNKLIELKKALELTLTSLRSMQEAGEPLSLEQLRKMDGKPVWIVEYPDWGHWELSEDANDYIVDRNLNFYGMKHDDPDGRYGFHKLGWLAYSYPPVHIDRSKWMAKNMTDQHPVDQFVCSECGAIFEDFSRCKIDEDSGDKAYYEYELKFCPACGRAVTEEAWAELERRVMR